MSHSTNLPPVHETSPPPFDDDTDENDLNPTFPQSDFLSTIPPEPLNDSNDDWKSIDGDDSRNVISENQDNQILVQNDNTLSEQSVTHENKSDDFGWANFATFETRTDETQQTPFEFQSNTNESETQNDWANFESHEPPVQSSNETEKDTPIDVNDNTNITVTTTVDDDDDDDFGEFSEVKVASAPKPSANIPINTLTNEQVELLTSTCFPLDSVSQSTDSNTFVYVELPSFTTYKDHAKQISYLESSLSLWDSLSSISNDPIGIQFQWRKSNTERLFHQALGVNERLRTKNMILTPEVLQPEKLKPILSTNSDNESANHQDKLSTETIRPHFDWKQSGLENPLTNHEGSVLSSNNNKTEDEVFNVNKALDLDFYVPPPKTSHGDEITATALSNNQKTDSPNIIQQRNSVPIKTMDLFPGSTTTLSDDAKRIIDSLPNLSFMSAKALMFPMRFNTNSSEESTTLY